MHKRKRFLSLGLSLMLAVGSMTVPTLAAEDFTDGTDAAVYESQNTEIKGKEEDIFTTGIQKETDFAEDSAEDFSEDSSENNFTENNSTEDDFTEDDSVLTGRIIKELPDGSVQVTEGLIPETENEADSDELFGQYANQFFYEEDSSTAPATSIAETVLSGVQQALYEEMKAKITSIAANGGTTKFKITSDLGLRWQTSSSGSWVGQEASQKFNSLNTSRIITCLLADCPYELYWYEKTDITQWTYNYSVTVSGGKRIAQITDLTVSMPVCSGYAYNRYQVNASMVKTAKNAAANAKYIVNEFKNMSEVKKLIAYKEMICYLTDYNYAAVSGSYRGGYGDPWQLIWVFDGNDSTKVVCEGYSKAFQYLCDLSDITCFTVTGEMDGGTGAGAHMWNIVEQNGRYYLADITNSDEGTAGENGGLFLNTPSYGSLSQGYTYETENGNIYFRYDQTTRNTYGTGSKSVLQMTKKTYDVDNTTVKPAKPTLSGLSNTSARKLVLTWKKSRNAKGYEIYRRIGTTGSYKKIATVKSGSTLKYTNTGLKKGTKYYYRIRAYSYNALGNKVYSGWSAVKSKTSK